jgi:hypothetical protein
MKLFECGIRYEKTLENGMQKKVTELYIVDALSFTEAESRIIGEMSCFISGEFDVVSEKITNYSELVENAQGDKWYRVKVNYITLDEKTGKEKKAPKYLLVQAKDIDNARAMTNEFMKDSMVDWNCEAVQETKIMDVFKYTPNAPHKKAQTYKDKVIHEATEAVASSPSCRHAAKRFIDSIPDGQKVTISATGCKDVVIDKTHDHEKVQDDA